MDNVLRGIKIKYNTTLQKQGLKLARPGLGESRKKVRFFKDPKSHYVVYLRAPLELEAHVLRIRSTHVYYKSPKYEGSTPSEL